MVERGWIFSLPLFPSLLLCCLPFSVSASFLFRVLSLSLSLALSFWSACLADIGRVSDGVPDAAVTVRAP